MYDNEEQVTKRPWLRKGFYAIGIWKLNTTEVQADDKPFCQNKRDEWILHADIWTFNKSWENLINFCYATIKLTCHIMVLKVF